MIMNCTPHTINVCNRKGEEIAAIPASGVCPRCVQTETVVSVINGIEVTRQTFGDVEGLPDPIDGTYLVVSRMVAQACPERTDLLVPGPLVRGEDGQPRGCRGLSCI